jgi:hypothetical protein
MTLMIDISSAEVISIQMAQLTDRDFNIFRTLCFGVANFFMLKYMLRHAYGCQISDEAKVRFIRLICDISANMTGDAYLDHRVAAYLLGAYYDCLVGYRPPGYSHLTLESGIWRSVDAEARNTQ